MTTTLPYFANRVEEDPRRNQRAWDIIERFAREASMKLPDAETLLKECLGIRFDAGHWNEALKAVMDAEGDELKGTDAVGRRPPDSHQQTKIGLGSSM